ncbi:hypothetical protein N7474_002430 [Penicillium riverlandense]|uniref:uncharacterized protein n=1 Tax=Penicillium riverlandense TaxID=1903569 RepID=UPI0025485050|nr:uncharacterized protein N7474_002430 [Penicillium riverlandense]KAJ5825292.1 hypothetical protein N7474_002430 [Penicillium riverlandense]
MCQECQRLGLPNCRPRNELVPRAISPVLRVRESLEPGDAHIPEADSVMSLNQRVKNNHDFNVSEYLSQVAQLPEGSLVGITRRGDLSESSALESQTRAVRRTVEEQSTINSLSLCETIHISQAKMTTFDPTEQHLLLHYVQHVSRALVVVNDDENPFLRDVLPLAMEVKSVRHALLALSACHLCKAYPRFEDTLLRQHSLSLHFLKLDVQSEKKMAHTLVASLLLCLFGICHGKSSKWILHLYGAKALVDSHMQAAFEPPPLQSAIDLYDLICCKTRITCNKVPMARDKFLSPTCAGESHNIHPLFGVARDLYQALESINQLVSEKATKDIVRPADAFLSMKARNIQKSLNEWVAPTQVDHSSPQLIRDSIKAAEALRWTAIIRLHQVMGWPSSYQANQQCFVQNILTAISHIPPGSPVNGQLLLPLFIAGVTATRKTQRLQIDYRISLLESNISMGNIAGAHQVLDLVWKHGYENKLNWEVFLQRDHPCVVLY